MRKKVDFPDEVPFNTKDFDSFNLIIIEEYVFFSNVEYESYWARMGRPQYTLDMKDNDVFLH